MGERRSDGREGEEEGGGVETDRNENECDDDERRYSYSG